MVDRTERIERLRAMDARERDVAVATRVMGQRRERECPLDPGHCPGRYAPQVGRWPCLPPYGTDVDADYAVLRHVRGAWRGDVTRGNLFAAALWLVWRGRDPGGEDAGDYGDSELPTLYEPGDWSLAALCVADELDRGERR